MGVCASLSLTRAEFTACLEVNFPLLLLFFKAAHPSSTTSPIHFAVRLRHLGPHPKPNVLFNPLVL